MILRRSCLSALVLCLGSTPLAAQSDERVSKNPPPGAPWVRDFAKARELALEAKKPIFVYSTKTYCPHCVAMEKSLLSDPALAALYDSVVWMYLFQDFSKSAPDRAAERIAIRFGISSWPQHFLVDPFDLAVLADTGRTLPSFRGAVESAHVKERSLQPSARDLAAADALAAQLEEGSDVALATKSAEHLDLVVRVRAVEILARKNPTALVERSAALLESANDQLRYLVCDALAAHGTAAAAPALIAILKEPGASKNPNVLRIHAVDALARCGDRAALDDIAPFAASGEHRNSLTAKAVAAVQTIAARERGAQKYAAAILCRAYPMPSATSDAAEERGCTALAKTVHGALAELTGKRVKFREPYTAEARSALVKSW